jgi:hypothetical protein
MANCTCTVAAIEAFCGGLNAPGLDRMLHLTCEDELLAIPAPGTGTHKITTPITYRAAATTPVVIAAGKFYKWGFSKEDQSFTSDRDEATGLWKTECKIFLPNLEDIKSYILNGLTGDNIITVVKDRNGKQRLIGALGNGASLKVKEQTNPKNGYEATIMWESAYSPYFYESTLTV